MVKVFCTAILGTLIVVCCGCDAPHKALDREIEIAIRCVNGQLSAQEKEKLLSENHPVLLQTSDPSIRLILQLFANLPDDHRIALRKKSYLKWQFSKLDESRQEQIATSFYVMANRKQPTDQQDLESTIQYLKPNCVGFIELETLSNSDRIICFYIQWEDHSQPAFLRLIGPLHSNVPTEAIQEFNDAIRRRIAMIRSMDDSPTPATLLALNPRA